MFMIKEKSSLSALFKQIDSSLSFEAFKFRRFILHIKG